jgi:DNA mismatch repair protein MutL
MIQSLPNDLVNLIAAGEVIDSFVAVVRELVENAIDAGATRLRIYLNPEQWQVQVIDNGQGMTLEDLQICALPHTTSKIQSLDDFFKINSLGFRGQALHSLSQVAELEIATRSAQGENVGWQASYNQQGEVQRMESLALAVGTLVNVKNLFANLPQRRQALSGRSPQIKAIQQYVQEMALCHPQITWQIWLKERLCFSLSPGQSAGQILPQILKGVKTSDLQYFFSTVEIPDHPNRPGTLTLWSGLSDRCHRHRPDWVKVALNQRPIHCLELEQTLINAFHRTLPRDRFPVCFLHLQVEPDQIDWNRHPAKTEIYLQSLSFWQEQITTAVHTCLQLHPSSAQQQQRVTQLLKTAEANGIYRINPLEQSLESQLGQATPETNLISLKAIGQVNQTYIIAEVSEGIWLIEQHIAHERVLYEQLQANWQCVPITTPLLLNYLTSAQVEKLVHLGIDIEPFGESVWAVRSVPAPLVQREDCLEALQELSLGGDLATAQAAIACRTAIKNGTPLTLGEMQSLLEQWQQTRQPRTCPHGRPIYLALTETALARFFRRNWMIGKSHGL